ncbi:MAG: hypothetical protein NT056_10015, partial [Proteobacteria bacterium]|nr:hypothetical protein [Pseudomonadota bacterium]
MRSTILTSESVAEGHPDKVADQISDAVVDAILREDPTGRVACETLVTTGLVVLAGEVTTRCEPDYDKLARQTIREIGYDAVEFAAPLSMDFADLGAHLAAIGLDCPSVHAGIDDMRDRPDAVLAMARNLGCRWIVLPFVMPDQRDWDRVIASLNAFARTANDAGFRVAYHHHDFEFAADPDGTRPF